MRAYVSRHQVRGINKKLFANDIVYNEEGIDILREIMSTIIKRYDPTDELANVPTILEVKLNNINAETFDMLTLLNPEEVILQFNSKALEDKTKRNIIDDFKKQGYKIIIEVNKDDKVFTVVKLLADIIKVDIKNIPDKLDDKDNNFECKKLAYNINTSDDFVLAKMGNMDYYEGTYITSSEEIEIEKTQYSEVNFFELLAVINSEKSSMDDIAVILQRDSLISAQVIRLSNSAYYYSARRIDSIVDAITRIGLNSLKKWIFLLQFSRNKNSPEELLQTSFHRATFCEKIYTAANLKGISKNDAYMIGLFSALNILVGKPMESILASMNLSKVIEEALVYRDGIGGKILNLVMAYEGNDWKRVESYSTQFRLSKDELYKIYFSSLDEVTQIWKSLTQFGRYM